MPESLQERPVCNLHQGKVTEKTASWKTNKQKFEVGDVSACLEIKKKRKKDISWFEPLPFMCMRLFRGRNKLFLRPGGTAAGEVLHIFLH